MIRALTCTVLATTALLAQPPRHHGWIPANAELVAHLDLHTAEQTMIGKQLLRRADKIDVATVDRFADWAENHELELGRDLRSITIYSTPPEEAKPVLIVAMSKAASGIFDEIGEEDGYWQRNIDGKDVHSFRTDSERIYAHAVPLADESFAVVFCQELDQVFDALSIIAGDEPSLVGSDNPLAQERPRTGRFLALAVTDVKKLTARNPASNVLKEASGFRLEAGEADGELFAVQLTLHGKTDESCENIANMAQGLIALARLIATNEDTPKEVKQGRLLLLNAIDVESEDREIHVKFHCPAEKVVAALRDN